MNLPASHSLLHCITRVTIFVAAMGLLATTARPALVVNTDLGTLGVGSVNLTGTTAGGPNNANRYSNSIAGLYWGSEYVYQFTTRVRAAISISSDDPNAALLDNDFYLLNTTATTPSGALNVGSALGGFIQINGSFGLFNPGTYFLVVDAYAGGNFSSAGNAGAFNAVLSVTPIVPALATPGGSITTTLIAGQVLWFSFNHPGGAFSVDTTGSTLSPDNDTELFLFNAAGGISGTNDDIDPPTDLLSSISNANLPAGAYLLAVGGYEMDGVTGPQVSSESVEAGDLVINGLRIVPAGADPHLAAVSLVGNTQTLRLTGTVGKTYLIEKSPSQAAVSWVQDGAPVTLTAAEQTITRTVGAGETRQFHRAREQ